MNRNWINALHCSRPHWRCYSKMISGEENFAERECLYLFRQLMSNHQKLFHVSNQSIDLLSNIRKKFLLIKYELTRRSERLELHVSPSSYWLQSFIHHLQFNTSMPNIERSANQVTEYFQQMKNPSSASSLTKSSQQQLTPINDSNPISPLSVTSQTSASDSSTSQQQEQHRYIYDFSKLMLNSYYSTCYWNKADRLMRDKSLKGNTIAAWFRFDLQWLFSSSTRIHWTVVETKSKSTSLTWWHDSGLFIVRVRWHRVVTVKRGLEKRTNRFSPPCFLFLKLCISQFIYSLSLSFILVQCAHLRLFTTSLSLSLTALDSFSK